MPNSQPRRPLLAAAGIFLLAAIAAAALIWHSEQHNRREESAHAVSLAGEYAQNLQRSIEHSLSATYALGALVRQGKGAVLDFQDVASQLLPMYPGVAELALVPGGVIRQVAPLAGNEKALGLDLLKDPVQKREALLARNSGKLTLAGPLELVQGGVGVVGRLPVFFDENTEQPRFWGFTLVVIRLPEALEVVNLSSLTGQGFAYELWREHPDTRQKQLIAVSPGAAPVDPVVRTLQVPNGVWNLSLSPVTGWGDPVALALKSALGLSVSLLLAYVAMLLLILRKHKQGLEALISKRTAALREGEVRYRELFDANPQPMWVYDMGTLMFLAVNDAAVAHYGYSREEFLAMRITDIRTPEEAARLMHRVEVVRRDDVRDAGLWQHLRKDGSLIDVEVTAHTLDFGGRHTQIVHVSDVTERLRAERALREGEARFRAIAELSSDWYWEQDENLRFVRPLTPMEGQQDVVPETFYGKTRRETSGVVFDEPQLSELEAICAARQPYRDFEIGRRYLDGPKRYVQLSGEPIVDAAGRFTGYRGIGKDITERKRAEAHLRLAASVFDHSQEGIMITDADANIVSVNKRFTQITGYSAAEAIGRKPRLLKSGRQASDFYRAMWAFIHAHGYWTGELWNRRKDGREYPEWLSISAVRDETGQVVNYVSVSVDISQRMAAEQALRASEEKFGKAFRATPMFVSISTVADGRYIDVNDAFLRATGRTRDEVIAHTAGEIGLWKNLEDRQRAIDALQASGRISNFEAELCKKSGDSMTCEIWAEPIAIGDAPCVIWVTNDVSVRKRAETEIRQLNAELEKRVAERTRALEVANTELEAFSYSVSHDLRAPLRAIQGFSRLVETQYASQIDEQGQGMLRRVGAGAQKMGLLIDDLLRLSDISRQTMRIGAVDLSALARELADELQAGEPERRAEWIIAPGVTAEGDAGLLRAALQNLIGNAWKYSSRRDEARIEFGIAQSDGRPVYFVRDNGAGFDMSYAKKLFGAFQRLHSTTEFPGTGIGLATVARILHRHGGKVWAEGSVGEGATFYFSLG